MKSRTWKRNLILLLVLITGLCMAVPFRSLYHRNRQMLIEQVKDKAHNLAITVATFLSYDIEHYRPLSEAKELNGELLNRYQILNTILSQLKDQAGATFLYTGTYLNENAISYVLDGEESKSVLFSPFG